MKKITILKTIALGLALSSASGLYPMAPDDAQEQNLKRHADDDGQQPEKRQRVADEKQEAIECCICQAEIEESESTAKLSCRHQFHQECVDEWFSRHDRQLVQRKCPLCRAPQAPSLLHQAIIADNNERVLALIQADVDLDLDGLAEGYTQLQLAISENNLVIVQTLLPYGANPNLPSLDGYTPLHYAAERGRGDVVRVLSAAVRSTGDGNAVRRLHAYVNIADRHGRTPLHSAAVRGHGDVVRMLLEAGTHVNIADQYGDTPLSYATAQGNQDVVRMLLEAGADVNIRDRHDYTPLRVATTRGDHNLVRMLEAATSPRSLASASASASAAATADVYQEQPAPAASTAAQARRVTRQSLMELRVAIIDKKPSAIALLRGLIAGGIDINIRGQTGETLLHLAAQYENIDVVRFLLAQPGIDLHARDSQNTSIIEVTRSEETRGIIQEAIERQQP